MGRLDWWRLTEELTPYEIEVLRIQEDLDPTGDQREDMRAAVNTAVLASATAKISESAMSDLMKHLTTYTEYDRERAAKQVASPAQAAAIFGNLQ